MKNQNLIILFLLAAGGFAYWYFVLRKKGGDEDTTEASEAMKIVPENPDILAEMRESQGNIGIFRPANPMETGFVPSPRERSRGITLNENQKIAKTDYPQTRLV